MNPKKQSKQTIAALTRAKRRAVPRAAKRRGEEAEALAPARKLRDFVRTVHVTYKRIPSLPVGCVQLCAADSRPSKPTLGGPAGRGRL